MQWGKYTVSTACQGSAAVAMQGEGRWRASIGHRVWAVACACHSGTPPRPAQELSQEPPRNPLPAQEPPPFLHRNHPRNPPGTPFLHKNPPLPAQEPPFLDPS